MSGCTKSCVCWLKTGTLSPSMNVWCWSFGERSVNGFKKCCPGMKWLDVWAEFCVAVDIAKIEGDFKLFLCEADWIHLIHNQLGTLGLKNKLDGFPHGVVMRLLKKRADNKYVYPVQKLLRKRVFGGLSPIWCCPEKWSGKNRISHFHWVKICVDPNGQIKLRAKNTKFFLIQPKLSSHVLSLNSQLTKCLSFWYPIYNLFQNSLSISYPAILRDTCTIWPLHVTYTSILSFLLTYSLLLQIK